MTVESIFDELVAEYPVWWIDALGEHNHVGGVEATRWLMARARLRPGAPVLDAGAFVGATARLLAAEAGVRAVATDVNGDFLAAGRAMEHGALVEWVVAANQRLPFADASFESVWCLDSALAPKEFTRVAKEGATLCLCCEVPVDGRGGTESFLEEWEALGWRLLAHRSMSFEATEAWRKAEHLLVRYRPRFEERYGKRGYTFALDTLADLVRAYEFGERGHALLVLEKVRG